VVEPALARLSGTPGARHVVSLVLRLANGRLRAADARAVAEYWAPTRSPDYMRAMRRVAHAFDWAPGRPEQLRQVRCPTTVLFGSRDLLVHPRRAERYVSCIPGAQLTIVPRAGHVLPEEAPADVAAAVLALAGRVLPPPAERGRYNDDNGLD
jgi:pimeloyl-ACP methyl ester carboxylesterase